jgi:mersacidin/lichenicidin family type 2 lantibiotic
MTIKDVIRAWKDSTYRNTLSEEQLAMLPTNPIGDALTEEELLNITGGMMNTCATDDGGVCSCSGSDACVNSILC